MSRFAQQAGRVPACCLRGCSLPALLAGLLAFALGQPAAAQRTPPVPAQNPQTPAKIALGKTLFWDEQLSLTGTVACGTCHRPQAGGSDPRTAIDGPHTVHPGPDGQLETADDIHASAGVPSHGADGHYLPIDHFGLRPQVGRRKAPDIHDAAFASRLFWDGRAEGPFIDPDSGAVLIPSGGALEIQSLQPLIDRAEMGHAGNTLQGASARIENARPLALATDLPPELADFIGGRDYQALFAQVFGTPEISAARIAFALASYQRELNRTIVPFDLELQGIPTLTAQELEGRQQFQRLFCHLCHQDARHTDDSFRYIGVRPVDEDLGRFVRTGNANHRGAFKVPTLRNVALRAPYMHNGGLGSLDEVLSFYVRGGDFDAPNKDGLIAPLFLSESERADLLAYLVNALTDPRIAAELPPFDRPTLYSESTRVPRIEGAGRPGAFGVPEIGALEPALLGNRNFTVTLQRVPVGVQATLVVGRVDPGLRDTIPTADFANISATTQADAALDGGYLSTQLDLSGNPMLGGQTLYGRYYIADPAAESGLSISRYFRITVFGDPDQLLLDGFE
jgi:cytochrome c peroxidase